MNDKVLKSKDTKNIKYNDLKNNENTKYRIEGLIWITINE